MTELWLIFKDPVDDVKRIVVDKPRFSVGRHSENDLCIADSRLSRQHLLIECHENDFEVSDLGSSNGTDLNGEKLSTPKPLKAGDKLCLGGLDIEIEFGSAGPAPEADEVPATDEPPKTPEYVAAAPAAPHPADDPGFPKSFFIIAPIFALVILTVVGIVIYVSGGTSRQSDNNSLVYSTDPDDPPRNRKDKNVNSGTAPNSSVSNDLPPASPPSGNSSGPTPPTNLTDTGKTEQNAASFLRRSAQNDAKAFITGQQAKIVETQIKSLASSAALADNLNSAKRSAAQIRSIAASKNLKPQLLAIAAITKLGGSKGDVLQAAQSMAEVLGKLGTQIGSELGDDCLLMMAAYDQGAAGDYMKMRNMLQDLATRSPESSRAIRTIWFLKQGGKISDEQFNFALRFLAIGTISQNPKDYGVNAEALAI